MKRRKTGAKQPVIYAFIDSQNLNLGVRDQGWKLDFGRFRVYLEDKYKVKKCFLFIGYIRKNEPLYRALRKDGYTLIFKPILIIKKGDQNLTKGNVDAELVLHTMIELKNFDKAIIVSGDGDFYCLIKYLRSINKLRCLVIPNPYKYSALFRRFIEHTVYITKRLKGKLENKIRRH